MINITQPLRPIACFLLLFEAFYGSIAIAQLPSGLVSSALIPGDKIPVTTGQASIIEELSAVRKYVLADRPYKPNPSGIKQVIYLEVQPTMSTSSSENPDWWSEKQSFDIANLYAIALSAYPGIKVLPPQTWENKLLSQESPTNNNLQLSVINAPATPRARSVSTQLDSQQILRSRFDIVNYSFQHLPVKRRGLGLGFIAITGKICSTETYLRSAVRLFNASPSIYTLMPREQEESSLVQEKILFFDRLIVDKTGGASVNLNFLLGGAGGGNFKEPAKPVKRIILESVVDASEALYCVFTDNQNCLKYYNSRTRLAPVKLTDKQKRKVEAC